MIVIHRNFLSALHGFRDNDVLLPTGYDVMVSPLPGGPSGDFFRTDSERASMNFLMVIYSNFLCAMHGFRDNEVLLQAGYDVMVISPPGGASCDFSLRILKERP